MMKRLCKEHKIQIIHVHGQRVIPIAWMLRMTKRIPFLWTNHIDAIPSPGLLAKMWRLMRFPIISVSTDLKNQLINELGIKENKITVVNNGVDLSTLQPLTEEEKAICRSRFGVKPDTYVIAEVARLNYVKGQHLLVRAVDAVNKKNLEVKIQILLAGAGEMEWVQRNVMDYAAENHLDCSYLGFCKPRDVYGIADLAVLSSMYEGFSISSIEAIAVGCPVLRSDSPGYTDMKEIVLVCRKNDVESLTDQLEYAITHREEMAAMAENGQKMVAQRFTKEIMCQQTYQVYRRILGE
jgi:glycosyltransferase involved in cell wall biosynthesis